MNDKEYESRVTQLVIQVVDIVRSRRRLQFDENCLVRECNRYNIDKRILNALGNEYERSLEEKNYKMKSIAEICADINKLDKDNDISNRRLEFEWALESGGDTDGNNSTQTKIKMPRCVLGTKLS